MDHGVWMGTEILPWCIMELGLAPHCHCHLLYPSINDLGIHHMWRDAISLATDWNVEEAHMSSPADSSKSTTSSGLDNLIRKIDKRSSVLRARPHLVCRSASIPRYIYHWLRRALKVSAEHWLIMQSDNSSTMVVESPGLADWGHLVLVPILDWLRDQVIKMFCWNLIGQIGQIIKVLLRLIMSPWLPKASPRRMLSTIDYSRASQTPNQ